MQMSSVDPFYQYIFEQFESNVRSYCRDFPLVVDRSEGSFIQDSAGRSYIDFFSGASALNYGHNHPELLKALLGYISAGGVTHSLDFHSVAKAEFLQTLNEVLLKPRKMNYKVQFPGPTGTNAVEAALKLARKVTGRSNVIAFTNAFHGMTAGSLAATTNPAKRAGAGVTLSNITFMPYEGYLGPDVDAFAVMSRLLAKGSGVDAPAAFLLETVQGEGGLQCASAEWMRKVAEIARSLGALLIVDDIQAGCGRTGKFFSFEGMGVTPDIICLSKSLSGFGLPLSLVLMRPELDVWKPGEHNGTFRGNNHAFVTATAALKTFWADSAFEATLANKISHLDQRLVQLATRARHEADLVAKPCGRGFMRGLSLETGAMAQAVSQEAFRRGLIIETCGVDGQVLKLLPALTIDLEVLDRGLDILGDCLVSVATLSLGEAA